jgi:hypothetical protein
VDDVLYKGRSTCTVVVRARSGMGSREGIGMGKQVELVKILTE